MKLKKNPPKLYRPKYAKYNMSSFLSFLFWMLLICCSHFWSHVLLEVLTCPLLLLSNTRTQGYWKKSSILTSENNPAYFLTQLDDSVELWLHTSAFNAAGRDFPVTSATFMWHSCGNEDQKWLVIRVDALIESLFQSVKSIRFTTCLN